MLQFWCLSPVRVAYHGSFRENLEPAFWGLGGSYHNFIKLMQVFKTEHLKCCSFDASPQSEWLITAHLERINLKSAFWCLGLSYHKLIKHKQVSKAEQLKCCSIDASPQSEWLITAHLERIWIQHFGALGCHITTLIKHMRVFKREQLKCCSFDASPQSEWLITAHLERIWSQHLGPWSVISQLDETHASLQTGVVEMLQFWCLSPVRVAYHGSFRENLEPAFWGLGGSYHNFIKLMQVFKTGAFEMLQFDASPQSEWLITAHLERIWSQHFGALGCHITSWLSTSKSPKRSSWNVAVLMPLPSQSGLSRLI